MDRWLNYFNPRSNKAFFILGLMVSLLAKWSTDLLVAKHVANDTV